MAGAASAWPPDATQAKIRAAALHDSRRTSAAGGFQDCRGSKLRDSTTDFTKIFCHRPQADRGCSAAPETHNHDGVIATRVPLIDADHWCTIRHRSSVELKATLAPGRHPHP